MTELIDGHPIQRVPHVRKRSDYYRVVTPNGGKSRTKQSFRDDCDINFIVKRHAQTGLWDHLNPMQPTYGDFSGAVSLQDSINQVEQAELAFMELPAEVRRLCDNDPVNLLRGLANPDHYEELVAAGLPGLKTRREAPPEVPADPPETKSEEAKTEGD